MLIEVPIELVPAVRELIAKHAAQITRKRTGNELPYYEPDLLSISMWTKQYTTIRVPMPVAD